MTIRFSKIKAELLKNARVRHAYEELAPQFELARQLPATARYENALAVADGDFVILHGRFSGHGLLRNWIVADIVRLHDGMLVEHWDVIQDEASEAESKSGLPMFGQTFAVV